MLGFFCIWIDTQALAHVWFTSWGACSLGLSSSWGGICTSVCWPCVSDLMTSVKEPVEGKACIWNPSECSLHVNERRLLLPHLTIYLVALGLWQTMLSVSRQFKTQYLLLNISLWSLKKNRIMLVHVIKHKELASFASSKKILGYHT